MPFLVKNMRSSLAKSVVEWFRAVAARTDAYSVAKVEQISNVAPRRSPAKCDLSIELQPVSGGRAIPFAVEAQERVSPLLATGILQRMAGSSAKGVPTLCTRVVSARVAELCRSSGVSYLDEAGNCRLSAPGFFLQVEGGKPVRAARQAEVDLFAVKSSRITRVLLGNPKHDWKLQELADEAQVSLGLVAKVKRALLEEAFVEERDRRLHLRDPQGLLEAWETAYESSGQRVRVYVMQKASDTEQRIADWCAENAVRFALTDLAGAWRQAPTVRYQQNVVYVEPKDDINVVDDLVRHLGARRVDSGANWVFVVPEDPFVLYQARGIDGMAVVSPVQLYLDLRKQPGAARKPPKKSSSGRSCRHGNRSRTTTVIPSPRADRCLSKRSPCLAGIGDISFWSVAGFPRSYSRAPAISVPSTLIWQSTPGRFRPSFTKRLATIFAGPVIGRRTCPTGLSERSISASGPLRSGWI